MELEGSCSFLPHSPEATAKSHEKKIIQDFDRDWNRVPPEYIPIVLLLRHVIFDSSDFLSHFIFKMIFSRSRKMNSVADYTEILKTFMNFILPSDKPKYSVLCLKRVCYQLMILDATWL